MFKKSLLSVMLFVLVSASFAADTKCGADKKNPDAECTAAKEVCILAMDPPVCKAPMEAGKPCKRDKVCASGKCDISADAKDKKGICK